MSDPTSGYSVSIKAERSMESHWLPRSGWRHRLFMLWPPYRRADRRRAEILEVWRWSHPSDRRSGGQE